MTTQLNKKSSVKTIDRVAVELGEDVDWLFEVAIEMEPEDGVIWVFSLDDKYGVMAFTPYGIQCLRDLIREPGDPDFCGPRRMLTLKINSSADKHGEGAWNYRAPAPNSTVLMVRKMISRSRSRDMCLI